MVMVIIFASSYTPTCFPHALRHILLLLPSLSCCLASATQLQPSRLVEYSRSLCFTRFIPSDPCGVTCILLHPLQHCTVSTNQYITVTITFSSCVYNNSLSWQASLLYREHTVAYTVVPIYIRHSTEPFPSMITTPPKP